MHLTHERWQAMGRPRTKVLLDGRVVAGAFDADEERGVVLATVIEQGHATARYRELRGDVFVAIERKPGHPMEMAEAERFERYMERHRGAEGGR